MFSCQGFAFFCKGRFSRNLAGPMSNSSQSDSVKSGMIFNGEAIEEVTMGLNSGHTDITEAGG